MHFYKSLDNKNDLLDAEKSHSLTRHKTINKKDDRVSDIIREINMKIREESKKGNFKLDFDLNEEKIKNCDVYELVTYVLYFLSEKGYPAIAFHNKQKHNIITFRISWDL